VKVVEILLARGANVDVWNLKKIRPFDLAMSSGYGEVAKLLTAEREKETGKEKEKE
jgi:hypothetical protein